MKILPVRFSTAQSMVMSFGWARMTCRPTVSQMWRASSKVTVRSIGTNTCRPVLPEVFTIASRDICFSSARNQNATRLPTANPRLLSSGSAPLASLPEYM